MIPKRLHFVWVGDQSKAPHALIDTWRKFNPHYEITLWGNESLKRGWRLAVRMQHFWGTHICGVADCMRWELLYEFGGIALDADSECLRPLEDWLLEPDVFACWESELLRPGLIANGIVGAIPEHPLIGQIIHDIGVEYPGNLLPWEYRGPGRLTETIRRMSYRDITIYPSHYFLPEHFAGLPYTGKGQVFARQGWNSTKAGWERPPG